MRVFVVEDASLLRDRLIRQIDAVDGLDIVGHADNATDAISQIRASKPDAILLDIRLKQSNGYQVLEAVKTPGQPPVVIVLTNFAYPQYRKKFMDSGADYFFDKSHEFDQAINTLKKLKKGK